MPFDASQPISLENYDNSKGEFDITPYNCDCCSDIKHTLALGEDETTRIYINEGCCGEKSNEVRARPYAQLGSVDVSMQNNCCCCGAEVWMVSTDGGPIAPAGKTGSCCVPTEKALVEQISAQLQELKVARGNIGLMKMHNANGDKLAHVASMLDALAAAKGASAPPCATVMDRTEFPRQTYNVTNWQEVPCCCRGSEQFAYTLVLEDDEARARARARGARRAGLAIERRARARRQVNFVTRSPCSQTNTRRPYAQLGVVVEIDEEAPCQCDCCTCEPMGGHAVEVDGIRIQPRLGMETQLCKTIAAELQARKVALGNIGQLKKGEQIRDVVAHVENTLGVVMQALGVAVPEMPASAVVAVDVEAASGELK